jgi:hypothetical protein
MSNVFPKSNLPVSSQPWGREIQKTVESLQEALARQSVNSGTSDTQLQASYRRLDETLNGLLGLGNSDSPFSINADNINGGTITGILLRSGTGGQRVEIEEDRIDLFSEIDELAAYISGTTDLGFGGAGLETKSGLQVESNGNMFLVTQLDDSVEIISGRLSVPTYVEAGDVQITSISGGGTTSASIDNAGFVIRTPSSTKYKQDIEPLEVDYEELLSLEPQRFMLKSEAEKDENARYYAGFIAEDIAETSLTDFVAYKTNEDGTKEPDGVYYAELSAALLSALKQQDELIKSLVSRVEALENSDKV